MGNKKEEKKKVEDAKQKASLGLIIGSVVIPVVSLLGALVAGIKKKKN